MPLDATPSGIHEWILRNGRARTTDSATLRFERMDSQAAYGLPEVHRPLDHRDPAHWQHRGLIWDFVLSMGDASRVLDVGPGDGWPSLLIAPHFDEVVGIEPGPKRVAACKANAQRMRTRKARFEQMSATAMDYRSGSFDGVVAATSIEQTPDPQAALREIFRVLKVGGVLRFTYEALERQPEPVREAITILRGPTEGTYLIDYNVAWTRRLEERSYLIEVAPVSEASRKRLEIWATRCADDTFPVRDPRLERGLVRTVKAIRAPEILRIHTCRLRHFDTQKLMRLLTKIGFSDVRCIVGGGLPAAQLGREMIQARRIEAAAPLMDEMCRGAARFGIATETLRPGHILAVKPRGRTKTAGAATRARKTRAAAKPTPGSAKKAKTASKPAAGSAKKAKSASKPAAGSTRKTKIAARPATRSAKKPPTAGTSA